MKNVVLVPSGMGLSGPNPCATITTGGTPVQGNYDGTNCTYPDVAGAGNNLTSNLRIDALPNGGAHIFSGSLFVGNTYNTDAELAAAVDGIDGAEPRPCTACHSDVGHRGMAPLHTTTQSTTGSHPGVTEDD